MSRHNFDPSFPSHRDPSLLSRRDLLKLGAGTLLSLGLWPGAVRADDTGQRAFRFIVVNDTHCQSEPCGEYFHRLALAMKEQQPEFVLHAGDLTHTAESRWFGLLAESFQALDCPWYPVMGNHDLATATDRSAYTQAFPDRLNYAFEEHGWQFVALDTTDGLDYENTTISPETFAWVDHTIAGLDPRKPTVLFTHFPLGQGVKYRPLNAESMLERFLHLNLRAVFCGHYHGFTEKMPRPEVPVTTNRCCGLKTENFDGTSEKGFFVCQAKDGGLSREFVEFRPEL